MGEGMEQWNEDSDYLLGARAKVLWGLGRGPRGKGEGCMMVWNGEEECESG